MHDMFIFLFIFFVHLNVKIMNLLPIIESEGTCEL